MSEHQWVSENLATFVADGLDAAERERLEQHTANCSECAAALADARAVSDALEELFVTERPDDALEDRLIQSLREQSLPWSWRRLSRTAKVLVAAAAVIVLTVTGAGLTALLEEDQLSFPGHARNNPNRVLVAKFLDDSHSMDFRGGTAFFQDLAASPEALASKLREQSVARLATKGVVVPPVLGYLDSPGTDARVTEPTEHRRNLDEVAGKISELKGKAEEAQRVLDRLSRLSGARAISAEEYNAAKLSAEKHAQDLEKFVKSDPVAAQAFSPDGKRLAASGLGPGTMAEYAKPPEVRIWAATTGTTYYGRSGENGKLTTKFEWFDDGRSKTVTYFKPEEVMATVCRSVSLVNQDKEKPGTDGKKDGGEKAPKADPKAGDPKQQPQAQPVGRKIIRSGDMEFEVDSFDNAVAIVNRLVDATKGGFVATTNSDKLPNGKVRGSVVVRVPPEQLDALILALRKELGKMGELRNQRIGSQDITKQYTDLESRLRAARTMEERLLKIIRDAKGEIKDLIQAEKELGVWRTRIEEIEGELRYYGSLIALSTLTITLSEKEIRAAARVTESERVQAGIEVEDVDQAMREALKAIADAKGRVTKSELKQHSAGQYNAVLQFEVAPEQSGPMRDRLRQIGTVARLEIDRVQQTDNSAPIPRDAKVKHGDAQFTVLLYNLAKVEPRETVTIRVAATDVPAAYRALREAVGKVGGQVQNAQLNEQDRQNVGAKFDFDVRRPKESAVVAALTAAGEVLSRQVTRIAEKENFTDAKVRYQVELVSAANVLPRETVTLGIEVQDVDGTVLLFDKRVQDAGGRKLTVQRGEERTGRVTARVIYDVPLAAAEGLVEKFKASGKGRIHRVEENTQAPEGKLALARLDVTLSNGELLVPAEDSLGARLRSGLSFSLRGLSVSASYLLVALLFILPWVLLIWAGISLGRRVWGKQKLAPATAEQVPAAAAPVK